MYDYRKLTPAQQRILVAERRERGFPWHGPPHPEAPGEFRIVTGACDEHRHYIHNNPVKHGYVKQWQDWQFSSVHWYLQEKGRDWLLSQWRAFPLLEYGRGWDNFDNGSRAG